MGFFTKKGFDQIRQDFAQLLVNYGYLNSIYDLAIVVVERKDWDPKEKQSSIYFEVYAMKVDEELGEDLLEIKPKKDTDLGNPINAEWYIGRGLTTKHAMQNLYCNMKEILEPNDEIADCYA